MLRIIVDPERILPGYLYTYLSSPLGKALIEHKTYGAVVPHIEAHHVMDLPVPRLEPAVENTIQSLIEQCAALRSEANTLLESAREEFLKAANLVPLTKADYYYYGNTRGDRGPGCFVVSSSRLSTTTINAWNYGDKFESLRQRIAAHGVILPLSELLVTGGYYTGGWYKRTRTLPGRGRELISQKQLFGIRKDGEWISSTPISDIGAEQVTEGMILIAGVGTMGESEVLGRCEFVHKNFENKLVVAEVIRVVADETQIDPGYLYAFLSSEYGFRLLRSTISGTKLCRFITPLVLSIPVPILPRDKQQAIGDMVRRAYDNRAIATERENQAQALLAQELGLPPELLDRAAD